LLPPLSECTYPEDGGSNIVRNFHKHFKIYVTSYARIIRFLVSNILTVLRVGLLTQLRHKAFDSRLLGPHINYRFLFL